MRNKKKGQTKHKAFVRMLWLMIFFSIFLIVGLEAMIGMGVFGKLPSVNVLENPKSNLASEVYSADQILLGKYFKENRTNVSFNEISPQCDKRPDLY